MSKLDQEMNLDGLIAYLEYKFPDRDEGDYADFYEARFVVDGHQTTKLPNN